MAPTTDTTTADDMHQPQADAEAADDVTLGDGDQGWLPLSLLKPHPDNPRTSLGDLDEMVRSIKAHGVLEPLLILPAHDGGVHPIVAGHRRHAAALKAGAERVQVVVRAMGNAEVLEAMLSENLNRAELTLGEEIRAIERLMSLDGALTPAKLCKRIGKSQAWVRARMTVTVLPATWRNAIDEGWLTLAAAEAAAGAADLGPDHLDVLCTEMARSHWSDPARMVQEYRNRLQREVTYDDALKKARKDRAPVFTNDDPAPKRAKAVSELFSGETRGLHDGEPCHGVLVERQRWGKGVAVQNLCTDPRRHSPKAVESGKGSKLLADRVRPVDTENQHLKRKGRLARLEHAIELFAKRKGGPTQAQLTRLALSSLVLEAGQEALKYAATILGVENPKDVRAEDLLASADSPAKLARLAGAVACGLAEDDMYWYTSGGQCRAWTDLLCDSGWTPDEWTAATLARRNKPATPMTEALDEEPDGDTPPSDEASAEDEVRDEVADEAVLGDTAGQATGDEVEDELRDEDTGEAVVPEPAVGKRTADAGPVPAGEDDHDLPSDITTA